MKLAAYILGLSVMISLISLLTTHTLFVPVVFLIAVPACLGATFYHIFSRRCQREADVSTLSATLSGILAAVLFLAAIKVSDNSSQTDGGVYGLIAAAIIGTPIVTVVAAVFGAGVGQRKANTN